MQIDTTGLPRLAAMIEATRAIKTEFTAEDVCERAVKAMGWGNEAGVTTVRSQVEADPFVELRAVAGMQQAVEQMADRITVQLAAFPQEGWFKTAGTREAGSAPYIEQALQRGVKVIGGNVNQGIWPSDPEAQVDASFQLALKYDCDLDLHLDNWDGPEAFTLPYVIQKTIDHGYHGRVVVSHIPSLAHVAEALAQEAIEGLQRAQITVAVLAKRIRLTRVRQLMEAGVNVLCATDNLRDKFIPYGEADPLADLLLLAQLLGMTLSREDLVKLWEMATVNAARGIRLSNYGIEVGDAADLMVLDAPGIPEAIWRQAERLVVLKRGKQVAGQPDLLYPNSRSS